MGIVTNSNLPNLILQLNVPQRSIFYKGITKVIPDNYWNDEIISHLYPLWDTDKDKLIMFTWYDNNTYHAQRRKYFKNFETGEYFWKDYEMEQMDNDEASLMFNLLKDTFYLNDSLENEEFQNELARIYAETTTTNWLTIRLARNFLLTETDWIFAPDSDVGDEEKQLWIKYRRALRDLPSTVDTGLPDDINFPISPKVYTSLYLPENPEDEYLQTPNQWLPLSRHYLTTFREKMVKYLIVKEVTEGIYFQSFMNVLTSAPKDDLIISQKMINVFNNGSEVNSKLDALIELIENNIKE
jgi:hypothetical protein